MTQLPNKREILQTFLDEIEQGWWIKKPSPADPYDIEYMCIFQKLDGYLEARVSIPNPYFQDNNLARIKELVRDAIQNAKTKEGQ